ncbi:MAG: PAS domain S-box protein [Nitrospirae bacterium]|nr:PAS domain S-box protein [Nitrospirota bacterium]
MDHYIDEKLIEKSLVSKLLPLLLFVFLFLFFITITLFYFHKKRELQQDISNKLHFSEHILKEDIEKDAKTLLGLLEFIVKDPKLETALINKDYDSLKRIGEPIFKILQSKYDLSHFTLIDPEHIVLIRYHNIKYFNDKINRYTIQQAEKTHKIFYGLELGLLGTFTLRVIVPWYVKDKLIGYIEIGEDINHVFHRIEETLEVKSYVLIKKNFLNQTYWKSGMKMLGYSSNWDIFPDYVIESSSAANVPQSLIRMFSNNSYKRQTTYLLESSKDDKHNIGWFPLIDASGKEVGIMIISDQYTKRFREDITIFSLFVMICLFIVMLLVWFFYRVLSRIDKVLKYHNNQLELTVRERTNSLLKAKEIIEMNYLLQNTLRNILLIATENHSLEEVLNQILSKLLNLTCLSGEGKGAIFLCDNDFETLEMIVKIGLCKEVEQTCQKIKFGTCLCGRSALSRKVIFMDSILPEHDTLCKDIKPHGHYIIPIIFGENLLGVLNFYVKEGTVRNDVEEKFLISIANTIATVIDRKMSAIKLFESEEFYRLTFENAAVGVVHSDRSGRFIKVNQSFCDILGYSSDELMNSLWQDIIDKVEYEKYSDNLKNLLDGRGISFTIETRLIISDHSILWVNLTLSLIKDSIGQPRYFLSIVEDISIRKKLENNLLVSLKEKELLLGEIHHRVKNNLFIVTSLLSLQRNIITDEKHIELFKESEDRIRSMALIHEKLYQSKDLATIDFNDYINNLINEIIHSYCINIEKIKVSIEVDKVYLGIDTAVPCGLLINELITNILKYAFPDNGEGKIHIGMHYISDGRIELIIRDSGIGIPEDIDIRNTKSLGWQLIVGIAETQLRGEIELNRDNGTEFKVRFKEKIRKEKAN